MAKQYLSGYQGNMNPACQATIANGGTASSTVICGGFVVCGVFIPAAFTGTALTFQASIDGITFVPVKSTTTGTALTYTVAPGQYNAIDPKDFYGINFLKLVSGSAEGAARTLNVALRGF